MNQMPLATFLEVEKSLYEIGCWPEHLLSRPSGLEKKEKSSWEAYVLRGAEVHHSNAEELVLLGLDERFPIPWQNIAAPMYPETGSAEEMEGHHSF